MELLHRIFQEVKQTTIIAICIHNSGNKVKVLNELISQEKNLEILNREDYIYEFVDEGSTHSSKTKYTMMLVKKMVEM